MTKINLLPPERVKERGVRQERNFLWLVLVLPLIVLLAMGFWWYSLGSDVDSKKSELDTAKKELADLQAKTASLKQYKDRQDQITQIEQTVVQALSGRVYWARILNNIAILCPLNVWLNSITGTSSKTAGTVSFEGYATQCNNRLLGGFYPGTPDYHPDFRPIAGWLDRMAQVEQFQRVWLASADPTFLGSPPLEPVEEWQIVNGAPLPGASIPSGGWVIRFSSNANLDMAKAALGTPVQVQPAGGGEQK